MRGRAQAHMSEARSTSSLKHVSAQVRFCVWLPVQLIGNLIAIAALPHMGALYEAAGAATATSVIAWGALYHLTLGLLLPGALRSCSHCRLLGTYQVVHGTRSLEQGTCTLATGCPCNMLLA